MAKSVIVYVDGFNLYNGVHDAFQHKYLWLDLVKLVQDYRPGHQILKVKYFTAQLLDDPGAQSRQMTYWNGLRAKHGEKVEIVQGKYKKTPRICRKCKATWDGYEEKETDVNLALAIARDAAEALATDYYIITGDSDAAPAVREAQRINPRGFYLALFPPQRASSELKMLMPNSFVIGPAKLRNAQLPLEIVTNGSSTVTCPLKWRPARFIDDDFSPNTAQLKSVVTASPATVARQSQRKSCDHSKSGGGVE